MFRTFNAVNIGSIGQMATKLLSVKVGGLKKKSAIWPQPHLNQLAWVRTRAKSNYSQSLMACDFAALWPTDPKFSSLKDLNLLKKYNKNQEASSILRVDFALSKWPHFHREFINRPRIVVRHCMPTLTKFDLSMTIVLDFFKTHDNIFVIGLYKTSMQLKGC